MTSLADATDTAGVNAYAASYPMQWGGFKRLVIHQQHQHISLGLRRLYAGKLDQVSQLDGQFLDIRLHGQYRARVGGGDLQGNGQGRAEGC